MTEFFVVPINIPRTKCHRAIEALTQLRQKLRPRQTRERRTFLEMRKSEAKDTFFINQNHHKIKENIFGE